MRIRKRHRLRRKEIEELARELESSFGLRPFTEEESVERAEGPEVDVVFVKGEPLVGVWEGRASFTVKGLLHYHPTRRFVTVDMGAVPFVCNGADVMGPGIVAADPEIREGDFVWVRDERNQRPLAVGRALRDGQGLLAKEKGKAVRTLHYVGDPLWKVGEEEPAPASTEEPSAE